MPNFNYTLLANDRQLKTAISMEAGSADVEIHLNNPADFSDLADFTTFLTGSVGNTAVEINGISGKINRILPLVHPAFPQLSCAGIKYILGVSESQKTVNTDAISVVDLTPLVKKFDLYDKYAFGVELQKRRYFLKSDAKVGVTSGTFYPADGSTGILYQAPNEWTRFTEEMIFPLPDTISATVAGNQRFCTHTTPLGDQLPAVATLYLFNQRVEITWFQVPYRYFFPQTIAGVTYQPYLNRFVNHVNQYAWKGRAAGALMFLGATPVPFIPQIPDIDEFGDLNEDLLCNVKLTFIETLRKVTDPPVGGDDELSNLNNIPAGHNCLPSFADRKFRYCPTNGPAPSTDRTKRVAPFPSFPFELLFCDPLFIQPGGPI